MKSYILFAFFLLALSWVNAGKLTVHEHSKAKDAVDSAYEVLTGLKQQNLDAQSAADARNITKEAEMKAEIDDLTLVADGHKEAGDAATEHRKYLEAQISTTNNYLKWIAARGVELVRKRDEYSEQRCVASLHFVMALKEHQEALGVVALLKQDVIGIVEEHTGENYSGSLAQMTNQADKLQAYAHLFKEKEIAEFNSLTQVHAKQAVKDVDSEYLEHDTDADDNQKKALQLQSAYHREAERDVGGKFIDMVNALEDHLIKSVQNLKDNEIQAAVDLMEWLMDTEDELVWLDTEKDNSIKHLDKCVIDLEGAIAKEERAWEIYFESAQVLNDAILAREKVREHYMSEKARRHEEDIMLDEIIKIFQDSVSTVDAKTRAGATDHDDDGEFNSSQGDYNDDNVDAMSGTIDDENAAATASTE